MKNKLKIGFGIVLVMMVMAVAVTGCTTSNIGSTGTALTMSARQVSSTTLYGEPVVKINATIHNDHAGTVRLSSNNFELMDSTSRVHAPIVSSSSGITVENGEGAWMQVSFYIVDGSHPTELTYYDGTNKVTCSVV